MADAPSSKAPVTNSKSSFFSAENAIVRPTVSEDDLGSDSSSLARELFRENVASLFEKDLPFHQIILRDYAGAIHMEFFRYLQSGGSYNVNRRMNDRVVRLYNRLMNPQIQKLYFRGRLQSLLYPDSKGILDGSAPVSADLQAEVDEMRDFFSRRPHINELNLRGVRWHAPLGQQPVEILAELEIPVKDRRPMSARSRRAQAALEKLHASHQHPPATTYAQSLDPGGLHLHAEIMIDGPIPLETDLFRPADSEHEEECLQLGDGGERLAKPSDYTAQWALFRFRKVAAVLSCDATVKQSGEALINQISRWTQPDEHPVYYRCVAVVAHFLNWVRLLRSCGTTNWKQAVDVGEDEDVGYAIYALRTPLVELFADLNYDFYDLEWAVSSQSAPLPSPEALAAAISIDPSTDAQNPYLGKLWSMLTEAGMTWFYNPSIPTPVFWTDLDMFEAPDHPNSNQVGSESGQQLARTTAPSRDAWLQLRELNIHPSFDKRKAAWIMDWLQDIPWVDGIGPKTRRKCEIGEMFHLQLSESRFEEDDVLPAFLAEAQRLSNRGMRFTFVDRKDLTNYEWDPDYVHIQGSANRRFRFRTHAVRAHDELIRERVFDPKSISFGARSIDSSFTEPALYTMDSNHQLDRPNAQVNGSDKREVAGADQSKKALKEGRGPSVAHVTSNPSGSPEALMAVGLAGQKTAGKRSLDVAPDISNKKTKVHHADQFSASNISTKPTVGAAAEAAGFDQQRHSQSNHIRAVEPRAGESSGDQAVVATGLVDVAAGDITGSILPTPSQGFLSRLFNCRPRTDRK